MVVMGIIHIGSRPYAKVLASYRGNGVGSPINHRAKALCYVI